MDASEKKQVRKKRSVAAAAPPERPPLNTVTMSSFKRNLIALTRTQDTTPQRKRARVPTPSPPSQQQSENSELPAGPAIEDDAAGMEMGSQEMLTPSCRTLPSAPHSTPVTKHRLGSSSKEAIPSGTADALLSASCQLLGPGESAQQDNSPPLSPPLELPSPSAAALLCTASPAKAAEADPAPSAKDEGVADDIWAGSIVMSPLRSSKDVTIAEFDHLAGAIWRNGYVLTQQHAAVVAKKEALVAQGLCMDCAKPGEICRACQALVSAHEAAGAELEREEKDCQALQEVNANLKTALEAEDQQLKDDLKEVQAAALSASEVVGATLAWAEKRRPWEERMAAFRALSQPQADMEAALAGRRLELKAGAEALAAREVLLGQYNESVRVPLRTIMLAQQECMRRQDELNLIVEAKMQGGLERFPL